MGHHSMPVMSWPGFCGELPPAPTAPVRDLDAGLFDDRDDHDVDDDDDDDDVDGAL